MKGHWGRHSKKASKTIVTVVSDSGCLTGQAESKRIDGISNLQYGSRFASLLLPRARTLNSARSTELETIHSSVGFWGGRKIFPFPPGMIGSGVTRCGKDFERDNANPLPSSIATMLIQCEGGVSSPFALISF